MQYDGTRYHGWQIQDGCTTIQEVLQKRICKITAEQACVVPAGRTDAGVHALAQVAAFKTESRLPCSKIKAALNALLPGDIRISEACDTDTAFHPRYDAKSKIYFYIIANMQDVSPFIQNYAWRIPQPLDLVEMSRAISLIKGTRDFTSFRASGCAAKSPVRTIFRSSIEKINVIDFMTAEIRGNFMKLLVEGDAFLRHMVRNIAGTIVEVGKGRLRAGALEELLEARDRRLAGPAAPARGLFLERVVY